MTAYLAGLAILRLAEHDARPKGVARLVLAAMASFASQPRDGTAPVCYASLESIARRSGVHRATVMRCLHDLEKLGVIAPLGKRGLTVQWRLVLLCATQEPSEVQTQPVAESNTRPVAQSNTRPVADSDTIHSDPSDSAGGGGRIDRDRPRSLRGAAAREDSTAPQPLQVVAEVQAARGGSSEEAIAWIAERKAASTQPIRNELAFIRGCLRREARPAKPHAVASEPDKRPEGGRLSKTPAADNECRVCGDTFRRGTEWAKAGLCAKHWRDHQARQDRDGWTCCECRNPNPGSLLRCRQCHEHSKCLRCQEKRGRAA